MMAYGIARRPRWSRSRGSLAGAPCGPRSGARARVAATARAPGMPRHPARRPLPPSAPREPPTRRARRPPIGHARRAGVPVPGTR